MATYYLCITTKIGNAEYKSGKYVDSNVVDIVALAAAGGLLVPSSNAIVAQAAAIVQEMWKQGYGPGKCDGMMLAAYTASRDTVDNTSIVISGKVMFSKPIASELISIFGDASMAGGALALIANLPNVPCRLNVRLTCIGGITTGVVTLVGVGADGAAITQVIPLTGVTRTVVTDEAFATITSATITGMSGNVAGDHISIGCSAFLGLPVPALATGLSVYKATVDYVNEAVGTVDAASRSVSPTTAANATREFEFWYRYAIAHTHTMS